VAGCADSVSGARRWLAYTGGFRARVCGRVATLLLSLAVRSYKGVFPALIRVHRVGSSCAGRARFFALTPDPSPTELKGVGFFSRGWHCGRDARVPSVARAGSASVSLA